MDALCPSATSEISLIANDLFYMDKAVPEVELPHFSFLTNNGASPTVKDICIDESVQSFEKILLEYEKCYSGNAISDVERLGATEMTVGEIPFEKIIEQKLHFLQELNSDFSKEDSSSHDVSTDENQDPRQNLDQVAEVGNLTTMAASSPKRAKESRQIEETVLSNKDLFRESTSSFSVTFGDVKLYDGNSTSDLEIKDASNISNYSKVITNQQTVQARNGNGTEETIMDSTSPQSSFANFSHGDSSLPGASLSGPMTTSSHIPYSGSISHRSDSSTTSARSFVFPLLQSEWNSSPVKMAKADRWHLRKHRWRTVLICCKF